MFLINKIVEIKQPEQQAVQNSRLENSAYGFEYQTQLKGERAVKKSQLNATGKKTFS